MRLLSCDTNIICWNPVKRPAIEGRINIDAGRRLICLLEIRTRETNRQEQQEGKTSLQLLLLLPSGFSAQLLVRLAACHGIRRTWGFAALHSSSEAVVAGQQALLTADGSHSILAAKAGEFFEASCVLEAA